MPKYIYVPVVEDRVEEVMRLLAGAAEETPVPSLSSIDPVGLDEEEPPPDGETSPDSAQMPDEDVRDAYRRGTDMQKRILEVLAQSPNDRISFEELGRRIDAPTPHSVPGSLSGWGRTHRYAGQRPYHFYRNALRTKWWIWADERVAEIIREEAKGAG